MKAAEARVRLVDYGMGNLRSVMNVCEYLGAPCAIAKEPKALDEATHVILPGVGSFAEGMRQLNDRRWTPKLRAIFAEDSKPILGICLGMQLLASEGTEGGVCEGLGLILGRIVHLPGETLRVPHMGWNEVRVGAVNEAFRPENEGDYYFVHSYYFDAQSAEDVWGVTEYGIRFASVVGRRRVLGVQFHPEKSHGLGVLLMKRFLGMSGEARC
ncbi:MAG: imidazole glycerol phosphate synthase subunit HisH [Candidatus Omnitrophica bacterium]|nr:imidazole glycerol phosphate synthase subunit HisH [Candidatus Omnitrophota bacterium]